VPAPQKDHDANRLKVFGRREPIHRPTDQGAKRIFMRFLLVAVVVNATVGVAVVAYDISHAASVTHEQLQNRSELLAKVSRDLRKTMAGSDQVTIVREANRLTRAPMALLDGAGKVLFATARDVTDTLAKVFPSGRPNLGTRIEISKEIGILSGAWTVVPFGQGNLLLIIAVHTPDQEGMFIYLSIAAGLSGLGIVLSVVVLLAAANWLVRRPLDRMVEQLTAALLDQLAFREGLIESSESVGILASDSSGRVRVFNAAATAVLGYPRERMENMIELDQLLKKLKRRSGDWAMETTPAPPPRDGEELWLDNQGREHLLSVSASDIHDREGIYLGRLIIFVDITERRRLEEELIASERQLLQSAKMATLGEMATGVAHELNQPLNNISLLTSRLRLRLDKLELATDERAFTREKLSKIVRQIDRAGSIIEHLRTFGRPSKFKLGQVDAVKAVRAALDLLQEQLTTHGNEVVLDLAKDLPPVHADEGQLEQVIINLVVNARDALDAREDREEPRRLGITASSGTFPDGDPAVVLVVEDNGVGIPLEVQERIFDPFFSTKEVGEGTGLGLSISYGLVRDFGGSLAVSSMPGKGTTFTIHLRPDEEGLDGK